MIIVGQPVVTSDGGVVAFLGRAARPGRAIVMTEDGSLMNIDDQELKPLVDVHNEPHLGLASYELVNKWYAILPNQLAYLRSSVRSTRCLLRAQMLTIVG
jgi:hypothetical protein